MLTAAHTPLFWRYDLNPATNPFLMERLGINGVFNVGRDGVERQCGADGAGGGRGPQVVLRGRRERHGRRRLPFLGLSGGDARTAEPETNVYDMRLTAHEDGWIYGLFCAERKDPAAAPGDLRRRSPSAASRARTTSKRGSGWTTCGRLRAAAQLRLHPEFVDGKYAFYTRPQDSFIEAGRGGGIGWGLAAEH